MHLCLMLGQLGYPAVPRSRAAELDDLHVQLCLYCVIEPNLVILCNLVVDSSIMLL